MIDNATILARLVWDNSVIPCLRAAPSSHPHTNKYGARPEFGASFNINF